MGFELSAEHEAFRKVVREFAEREGHGVAVAVLQTPEVVCASVKVMPSAASRSMFGVGIFDSGL